MKKSIIILVFVAFVSDIAFSQVKFGVLAGASNSMFLNKRDIVSGPDYVVSKMPNADYGFNAGVFLRLKAAMFLFQPEMFLSTIDNKYQIKNVSTNTIVNKNDRSFNLEMPIMFGIKTGPVKFVLGPSGRLSMFSLNQLEKYTNYKVQTNNLLWSIQIGTGLDFMRFQFNLRYEIGVSKITDGVVVNGQKQKFDSRSNQLMASIGWVLK